MLSENSLNMKERRVLISEVFAMGRFSITKNGQKEYYSYPNIFYVDDTIGKQIYEEISSAKPSTEEKKLNKKRIEENDAYLRALVKKGVKI